MMTCIAIALTCWLCTLVVTPQRPLPGNEVQELVYARLLGRRERVMLLALAMTIIAFASVVVSLPQRAGAEAGRLVHDNASCAQVPPDVTVCATMQPGTRAVREVQDDGKSAVVSTLPARTTGP